jgi:uncharacterized protein (TIGR03084 family)
MAVGIIDDLVAEQDRLEGILGGLPAAAWLQASGADGWTVRDVVLHLAQTEEVVVATIAATEMSTFDRGGGTLDEAMDRMVRDDPAEPAAVFERWRAARRAAVDALRSADPSRQVGWAAAPLKPATLATTRLAEHWAHGLDIVGPLGIPFPDTGRLRHIAWLGYGTLPYAFRLAGIEPGPVYCELTAPDGSTWRYGPPDAASTITGPAGEFCRVGARRLAAEDSSLRTTGPVGATALTVLRNYAG